MSVEKPIIYQTRAEMPETVISEASMLWNKTGTWRYLKPGYQNKVPPCNNGCPAGNDIEGFLKLIADGKPVEAWKLIKEENPFPRVCGRVCYHPCETVCNRSEFDQPPAINALERFAGDQASKEGPPLKVKESTGKSVVIIGSGPAGLTAAYHLARMGHEVTLFEAKEKPGGLMRYAIPEYRLPNEILDAEIEDIIALGVDIQCHKKVGQDIKWEELKKYDAVFISTGVHKNRLLGIPAEKTDGVISGLEFLEQVERREVSDPGKRVTIIGGGNSAIDSARTAIRMGSEVSIYYHRSKKEMPAFAEELQEAEREGVTINYLTQPVKIIAKNGAVSEIQFRRTRLGEKDESGRRRPVPVDNSEFYVPADLIITAIGEMSELDFLPEKIKTDRGQIIIDEFGMTSQQGVYAGGDVALSTHNVTVAIGSGKAAACAIDAELNHKKINQLAEKITVGEKGTISIRKYLQLDGKKETLEKSKTIASSDQLNLNHFESAPRSKLQKLSITERTHSFAEINKQLTAETALEEAGRCFHCGTCIQCDNCYIFCPDAAITKAPDTDLGYIINFDYCKGCGICVYECPRSAMIMEEEQ